ncbi:MAG: Fe-S cluster assembly sulfur transfer protein SufU [Nanoarchaeota archaeon]
MRQGSMKEDFPILKNGLIYLDNSATAQKPTKVIEAVKEYYENDNANVHRGIYKLAQKSTLLYEKAHEAAAKFIGAEFEEIIFTKGTTEGLNLLAYSLGKNLKAGDEIVLTEMEHHSNIVPWQQIAKEREATVKFIPITKEYRLDLAKAQELITAKTKIVSVVHMSNVLGTINPAKELAAMAHKVGAIIILDAAQSVPHLKINVKELDCDFLVFSGHKMCGPAGIGVLYGKKELLEKMDPFQFGGGMINEVTFEKSTWNQLPWKFEAGTPNLAGAAGLMAAIEYLQNIGMENISAHGQELAKDALERLSVIPGLTIIGPADIKNRGPIISFTIDGMHPHDVNELLDKVNIAVRGGFLCTMPLFSVLGGNGATRVSPYIYNDLNDVDKLITATLKIIELNKAKTESLVDLQTANDEIIIALTEEEELCKENLIDHYKSPKNKGEMEKYTLKQKQVNPLCGDQITVYLKLENDKIIGATFTGSGCAISQASVSMLLEKIKGKEVEDIKSIGEKQVLDLLGIPISPTRINCALLSLKTLHRALLENDTHE